MLQGHPTLRHPEGSDVLEPWDLVLLPDRPGRRASRPQRDGRDRSRAHVLDGQIPAATVYPDSDKIGIWTGNKADDLMVERSSGVGYWLGETS